MNEEKIPYKKIFLNTLMVFFEKFGNRIFSFLITIYIVRSISVTEFGRFTFAVSFASLFLFIAEPGIIHLTIKDLSSSTLIDTNYLKIMSRLKILLSFLTIVIATILSYSQLISPPDTYILTFIVMLYLLIESMGTFWGGIFQAKQKMEYLPLATFIEKISLFVLLYLILRLKKPVVAELVGLAFVVSACVYFLFLFRTSEKIFNLTATASPDKKPQTISLSDYYEKFKQAIPFGAISLFMMVYYNTDIVMLGKIKGETSAGFYGVSYKLFFTIAVLSGSFLTAIFPVMSRLYRNITTTKNELNSLYEKSFQLLSALSIPIALGGFILSKEIIIFLYGYDYLPSIASFKIFSVALIFSFINGLAGYYLLATNRQIYTLKLMGITTFANVILNFFLIPPYGATGAAIATLITETIFFVTTQFFIIKIISSLRILPSIIKIILSAIVMSGVVILLSHFLVGIYWLIPIILTGGVVYCGMLLITGYLDESDKILIRNVISDKYDL